MYKAIDVVVGGPIHRLGAYVLDKFMSNQRDIQREYLSCELVLATNEIKLGKELEQLLYFYRLRGKVILYETVKPDYARSRVWNIACGREAIRQYVLSQTKASYYLSVDADMVYDPAVIKIMVAEAQGYDVVFSGYPFRDCGIGLTGAGCMLVNRRTLEKIKFRVVEFKNGQVINEDTMCEMDSFQQGLKIKKGIFLHISHYKSANDMEHVAPQTVGIYRRITTSAFIRYLIIRVSLMFRYNIPKYIWIKRWRLRRYISNPPLAGATSVSVVVGAPIHRQGAYVIDKFLANQQQIQQTCPSSELLLATNQHDFIKELESLLSSWKLKGTVISYTVEKPDYARSGIWNIACGREAIRNYVLSRTDARYLLFLDADMTFDPSVVSIMEREIRNHDAAFSGYPLHRYGIGLGGCGCVMLTRSILEKLRFRCYEFKSGEVIFEDNLLEMDLFRSGGRVKKGFFIHITHYENSTEGKHIEPQRLGLWRKITNNNFIRYLLIRTSIAARYNIPWHLKVLISELTASRQSRKH